MQNSMYQSGQDRRVSMDAKYLRAPSTHARMDTHKELCFEVKRNNVGNKLVVTRRAS